MVALTAIVVGLRVVRREVPVAAAPPALALVSEETASTPSVQLISEYREPSPYVGLIPALGTCRRPGELEQQALVDRVATWIERSYPGEHYNLEQLSLGVGCIEPKGIVVDAYAGRWEASYQRQDIGRWWTLRVSRDRIMPLVETTGGAIDNWMMDAIEIQRNSVAIADLDRDGELDALSVLQVHVGGTARADFDLSVLRSRGGMVHVAMLRDVTLQVLTDGRTMLEIAHVDGRMARRCIDNSLRLTRC